MVSKEKREELAKKFQELSRFAWWESITHDDMDRALILVNEVIKFGWVPVDMFPVLTPEQEVDVMDRIISGLPVKFNPPLIDETWDDIQKLKVDMVFPDGEPIPTEAEHKLTTEQMEQGLKEASRMWERIPHFDNYEINPLGVVRSRWTKRELEVEENCGERYVEMHDKDGFSKTLNIRFIKEQVFGS